MRLSEVEKKARNLGIKDTWRYTKPELIKAIQRTEGNNACFGAAKGSNCGQQICCWRTDCLK